MKKQNRIMKELKSEATHLIKQGGKLYWKVPHKNPNITEGYYYGTEAIHILDPENWPDKEEFSREEVEIEYDDVFPKMQIATYKGVSAPIIVQAVIDEVERISTEPPKLHTPIETLNHVLSILKKRRSSNTGLGGPIILLEDAINRLEAESARYKGEQELDKNESDILEKTYKRLLSDSPTSLLNPTDTNVGQSEEPSPVEQFRAEIVRMLEERTSELKRDKYIDTRDKAIRIKEIRLIMTMVKSVK